MSDATEAASLPEDVAPRALALLARGGLRALAALVAFVGAELGVIAGAAALMSAARGSGLVGALLSTVIVVCGLLIPVSLHVGPLAAFVGVVRGDAKFHFALDRAWSLHLWGAGPVFVSLMSGGALFTCAAVFAQGAWQGKEVPWIVVGCSTFSLGCLAATAGLHGLVLVSCADYALKDADVPVRADVPTKQAIVAGATPFVAAIAFGGAGVVRVGAWVSLGDEVLVLTTLVGTLVAHVVSCAIAVAIVSGGVSRGEATP